MKIATNDLQSDARARRGFTLVELMAVVAIIGVLMSLLLTAVQSSREMARKATCASNLRNQLLAVHEFHAAHRYFPPGRQYSPSREYSWCLESLAYLEQTALYSRYDPAKPWSDTGGNSAVAQTNLRIFRCPSAIQKFDGKTDYGGVMGSTITVTTGFDFENGVMIEVGKRRNNYLIQAEIVDGTSQTIALAECTDRPPASGLWISGWNAFSHDNGPINGKVTDDICSRHPGGALIGFADGRVQFLSEQTAPYVVGSLCTRNGGEMVNAY
jgi:prepilin-type N-terminal cleavage/methylation domain-containing protein/prepilin-type processing-associated H-X9-DG protein